MTHTSSRHFVITRNIQDDKYLSFYTKNYRYQFEPNKDTKLYSLESAKYISEHLSDVYDVEKKSC